MKIEEAFSLFQFEILQKCKRTENAGKYSSSPFGCVLWSLFECLFLDHVTDWQTVTNFVFITTQM